jgi:hypothetical protein
MKKYLITTMTQSSSVIWRVQLHRANKMLDLLMQLKFSFQLIHLQHKQNKSVQDTFIAPIDILDATYAT